MNVSRDLVGIRFANNSYQPEKNRKEVSRVLVGLVGVGARLGVRHGDVQHGGLRVEV